MARMLLLVVPAIMVLAACGAPPSRYDTGYRTGYSDGYRSAYGDRYGYGYSSYGYNDGYAYRSAYDGRSRYRNLQRPSDY